VGTIRIWGGQKWYHFVLRVEWLVEDLVDSKAKDFFVRIMGAGILVGFISSSISQHRKQLRFQNLPQMADDATVVNFDISPDAFTIVTPKSKSSGWKDRLKAKRAVEHRANKRAIQIAEVNIAPTIPPTASKTSITAVKPRSSNEKPKQKPARQASR